jgi:hypothetical protein
MDCGTKSLKNYDINNHPMCLELVLWILVIFYAIFVVISMIVGMHTNNFIMANHEMQVCGLLDFGFVCLRFLIKCFIL